MKRNVFSFHMFIEDVKLRRMQAGQGRESQGIRETSIWGQEDWGGRVSTWQGGEWPNWVLELWVHIPCLHQPLRETEVPKDNGCMCVQFSEQEFLASPKTACSSVQGTEAIESNKWKQAGSLGQWASLVWVKIHTRQCTFKNIAWTFIKAKHRILCRRFFLGEFLRYFQLLVGSHLDIIPRFKYSWI